MRYHVMGRPQPLWAGDVDREFPTLIHVVGFTDCSQNFRSAPSPFPGATAALLSICGGAGASATADDCGGTRGCLALGLRLLMLAWMLISCVRGLFPCVRDGCAAACTCRPPLPLLCGGRCGCRNV